MRLFMFLFLIFFLTRVKTRELSQSSVVKLKTRTIVLYPDSRRKLEFEKSGLYVIQTKSNGHTRHVLEILKIKRIPRHHVIGRNTFLVNIGDEVYVDGLLLELNLLEKFVPNDKSFMSFGEDFRVTGSSRDVEFEVSLYSELSQEEKRSLETFPGVVEVKKLSEYHIVVKVKFNFENCLEFLKGSEKVVWVDRRVPNELKNFGAKTIILGYDDLENECILHKHGIDGRGQIVGCMDTGLDPGNCFFHDASNIFTEAMFDKVYASHRKIYFYEPTTPDNSRGDEEDGHGTHVVGSILGSIHTGDVSNFDKFARYAGIAPEAKVFFQDVAPGGGPVEYLLIPELYPAFTKTYENNVRIHSNSWGGVIDTEEMSCVEYDCVCMFTTSVYFKGVWYWYGDPVPSEYCRDVYNIPSGECCRNANKYDSESFEMDRFSFDHDEFLLLVAAGNDGDLARFGTVGTPGTAKNVLTVGASMNTEQAAIDSDYWNDFRDGLAAANACTGFNWNSVADCCTATSRGFCSGYSLETIKLNCCPVGELGYFYTGVDKENLASFSSGGPTTDERIKPDVVVPGTYITSARSEEENVDGPYDEYHCADYDVDDYFVNYGKIALSVKQGTSMSTPLAAGTVALIRQYFVDGYYPTGIAVAENKMESVSGMLLKAMVIHSAVPMSGTVWKGDNELDLSPNWPNNDYGWGRIRLDETVLKLGNESPSEFVLMVRDRIPIDVDQVHEYRLLKVGNSINPAEKFVVTMTWYEPEPSQITEYALMNDIDLVVELTSGASTIQYFGNNVIGGDRKNINEKVIINEPLQNDDQMTIRIVAQNIVSENLTYALVVTGYGVLCFDPNFDPVDICTSYLCNPICGSHGSCVDGTCVCDTDGWSGSTCEVAVCDPVCENGGLCVWPQHCDCSGATKKFGSRCEYCAPSCHVSMEMNGLCTKECYSTECFDGISNCEDCVAAGCDIENELGNGVCDPNCNNEACGFDYGDDCFCEDWKNDGVCDSGCNLEYFNYDGDDCIDECTPLCTESMRNNGQCDIVCNYTACNFDDGDCGVQVCVPKCVSGHGECVEGSWVCECTEGMWQGTSCEIPICPEGCLECSDPSVCTKTKPGFAIFDDGKVYPCHETCGTSCDFDSDVCVCDEPSVFGIPHVLDGSIQCRTCDSVTGAGVIPPFNYDFIGCAECSSETFCTKSKDGFILVNEKVGFDSHYYVKQCTVGCDNGCIGERCVCDLTGGRYGPILIIDEDLDVVGCGSCSSIIDGCAMCICTTECESVDDITCIMPQPGNSFDPERTGEILLCASTCDTDEVGTPCADGVCTCQNSLVHAPARKVDVGGGNYVVACTECSDSMPGCKTCDIGFSCITPLDGYALFTINNQVLPKLCDSSCSGCTGGGVGCTCNAPDPASPSIFGPVEEVNMFYCPYCNDIRHGIPHCSTCVMSEGHLQCTLCDPGFFLNSDYECVDNAGCGLMKYGYHPSVMGGAPYCRDCSSEIDRCVECSTGTECSKFDCGSSGRFFHDGYCRDWCPRGFFKDSIAWECKSCSVYDGRDGGICNRCTHGRCTSFRYPSKTIGDWLFGRAGNRP